MAAEWKMVWNGGPALLCRARQVLLRHFLFLQRMPAATMSAYFSAPRQILKNGPKRQNNNNVKAVARGQQLHKVINFISHRVINTWHTHTSTRGNTHKHTHRLTAACELIIMETGREREKSLRRIRNMRFFVCVCVWLRLCLLLHLMSSSLAVIVAFVVLSHVDGRKLLWNKFQYNKKQPKNQSIYVHTHTCTYTHKERVSSSICVRGISPPVCVCVCPSPGCLSPLRSHSKERS